MIKSKTVFVVGAGASYEVDLPTGDQLRNEIRSLLQIHRERNGRDLGGDALIIDSLRWLAHNSADKSATMSGLLNAANIITRGLAHGASIDTFINAHADNPFIAECGKIAIARAILQREAVSKIAATANQLRFDNEEWQQTWLHPLYRLLETGITRQNYRSLLSNAAFIVFNYDRCLEHFLVLALDNHLSVGQHEAREVISAADILHPYGVVGQLPWYRGESNGVDFGQREITAPVLCNAAKSINTIYESRVDRALQHTIIKHIAQANRVVFLGFGYAEENLEVLRPNEPGGAKQIVGTTFGISAANTQQIELLLPYCVGAEDVGVSVILSNMKSSQLLWDYFRLLQT